MTLRARLDNGAMATSLELQGRLREAVVERLGRDALRSHHRQEAWRSVASLAHLWLAIGVGFALAGRVLALPWPAALALGLPLSMFMATRINALNVLVHEGSHYALAKSRRLNGWLTNWGAGYWILFDEDSYRTLHDRHHRLLNQADDPDLPLYRIGRNRRRLLLDLLADLCWVSLFRRALVYREQGLLAGGGGSPALRHLAGKAAANAILLSVQVAAWGAVPGVLVYALFWVVPLFSFYPMIIRLRLITEHFAPEVFDPDAPAVFVARTSVCGPLEHYLFGAQMDYHFEHHLFPGIPYHELRRMHGELVRAGFFDGDPRVVAANSLSGGYFAYWRAFLRSDWFGEARGGAPAAP